MLDFMPGRFPGISRKLGQMVTFGLSGIKSSSKKSSGLLSYDWHQIVKKDHVFKFY